MPIAMGGSLAAHPPAWGAVWRRGRAGVACPSSWRRHETTSSPASWSRSAVARGASAQWVVIDLAMLAKNIITAATQEMTVKVA